MNVICPYRTQPVQASSGYLMGLHRTRKSVFTITPEDSDHIVVYLSSPAFSRVTQARQGGSTFHVMAPQR